MGPQTSSEALTTLQNNQKAMQSPEQELQQAQQNLGTTAAQQQVSGLRQAINNTTSLLNNIPSSVQGRTANSLETAAQAGRETQLEQAPVSAQLGQQTQDYNSANANYSDLEQQAESMANANEAAQQNKIGYLENIYSTLYGQEQAKQQATTQQKQFEQSLAEQQREANLSASTAGASAPTFNIGGLGSGASPTAAGGNSPTATMTQRTGGGFNINYGGQAINAAQYAHLTGQDFRTVLQQMASKGDSGAKAALAFVGNDYGYDPTKITTQAQANLYKALTGRTAKITAPVVKASTPTVFKTTGIKATGF